MNETRGKGRPRGAVYPHQKSLKLREVDTRRLEALAAKLDRDQSWVIRQAVERMAREEAVCG